MPMNVMDMPSETTADAKVSNAFARPEAQGEPSTVDSVADALERSRDAQRRWRKVPIERRLAVLREMRLSLADAAETIATELTAVHPQRNGVAETLSAELLPLLDAIRFLERRAARLLSPRQPGRRGRPWWMMGVQSQVVHEPHGVVLIIAPFNFPLMLPGITAMQALAAGNSVVIKPGRNGSHAANLLQKFAFRAGLPDGALIALDESVDAARAAIEAGPDFIAFTGSASTGQQVAMQASRQCVPLTMELSGCDAVFVDESADLDQVAAALTFGVRINSGATCIAPRRVFVPHAMQDALLEKLRVRFERLPPMSAEPNALKSMRALIDAAVSDGARVVTGRQSTTPYLIANASPDMALLQSDVFAPVLAVVAVDDMDEAVELDERCPYALGASIFADHAVARRIAARLRAGSICINDLIVPTVDPRLPFGGTGRSGYGVTRGEEGLLAMTRPKAISSNTSRFRPHYDESQASDEAMLVAGIGTMHGRRRLRSLVSLLRRAVRHWRGRRGPSHSVDISPSTTHPEPNSGNQP